MLDPFWFQITNYLFKYVFFSCYSKQRILDNEQALVKLLNAIVDTHNDEHKDRKVQETTYLKTKNSMA